MRIKQRSYTFTFGALLLVFLCMVLGGCQLFPSQQTNTQHPNPTQESTASGEMHSPLLMNADAHLIIPSIGLNAPIENVGVTPKGQLDVPTRHQWDGVGWYDKGPLPGDKGSAIIDGHLDRPGGKPAVFWNLHKLAVGDQLQIVDKLGHKTIFQVLKTKVYPVNKAPIDQIFGDQSGYYLNLITCAGDWSTDLNTYAQRLVVYTKLVQ